MPKSSPRAAGPRGAQAPCHSSLLRSSHRTVRSIASSASGFGMPGGVHTSSGISTSLPSRHSKRTTSSGRSLCVDPSMCERKVTPSSATVRNCAREKTW